MTAEKNEDPIQILVRAVMQSKKDPSKKGMDRNILLLRIAFMVKKTKSLISYYIGPSGATTFL